jgi:TPR repeat protein
MECALTSCRLRRSAAVRVATLLAIICLSCSCSQPSREIDQLKARADRGEAAAQFSLACRYGMGIGVRKDAAKAGQWFRKAAEQGDIGAEYALGSMLFYGEGIERDVAEGQKWLLKASNDNPHNPGNR